MYICIYIHTKYIDIDILAPRDRRQLVMSIPALAAIAANLYLIW